jgi:archaellum component FlaC
VKEKRSTGLNYSGDCLSNAEAFIQKPLEELRESLGQLGLYLRQHEWQGISSECYEDLAERIGNIEEKMKAVKKWVQKVSDVFQSEASDLQTLSKSLYDELEADDVADYLLIMSATLTNDIHKFKNEFLELLSEEPQK